MPHLCPNRQTQTNTTVTEHWFGYVHDGSVRVDFAKAVNRASVTVGYAGLFGLPLSQPTIIAHDRYGRIIGQTSINLAPTDTSRDLTLALPTADIAWVEITAPFNSEPVLIRGVRYANTTGRIPGELSTLTDANGDYSFAGLAPGNFSLVESAAAGWRPVSPTAAVPVTLSPGQVATGKDFGNFHVLDAGVDQLIHEGSPVAVTAQVNDPNPANGSNFTFLWHVAASNGQTIADGTGAAFTFTPNDNGIYTATVTLTDKDDANKTYQDSVQVFVTNAPPTVSLGADRTVNEGTPVSFANVVSDPGQADSLTYLWHVTSNTSQTVADGTDAAFTFTPLDNGIYTVKLTAQDNHGGTATGQVLVTVNNVAPAADLGPDLTRNLGNSVTLHGAFADPGAFDTFTYSWHVSSSNGQTVPDATTPDLTFMPLNNGVYTVTFAVQDDDGGTSSDQLIVTVNNVSPQNVNASGNRTVNEGKATLSFPGLVYGKLPDGAYLKSAPAAVFGDT